ncbi:hypothetical protein BJ742DRAFT_801140, partial [Cladochytrium replicatum]
MDWSVRLGEISLGAFDVAGVLFSFLVCFLVVINLLLHVSNMGSGASPVGSRFHLLITVALRYSERSTIAILAPSIDFLESSLFLCHWPLDMTFRYYQRVTEEAHDFIVHPSDVLLETKVTGCIRTALFLGCGLTFVLTTLDRFSPFAKGFGLPKWTMPALTAFVGLSAAVGLFTSCAFVFEYRYPFLQFMNSLFWCVAGVLEIVVGFSMVWATVANKRVVFLDSSDHPGDRGGCMGTLRRVFPKLVRTNRTLMMLFFGLMLVDAIALSFLLTPVPRRYFIAITFAQNSMLGIHLVFAFAFLSMFRNVLRLEANRRQPANLRRNQRPKTGDGMPLQEVSIVTNPGTSPGDTDSPRPLRGPNENPPPAIDVAARLFLQYRNYRSNVIHGPRPIVYSSTTGGESSEHLSSDPPRAAPVLRAVLEYIPSNDDELIVNVDDLIQLHHSWQTGWGRGQNLTTGDVGVFPLVICGSPEREAPETEELPAATSGAHLPHRRSSSIVQTWLLQQQHQHSTDSVWLAERADGGSAQPVVPASGTEAGTRPVRIFEFWAEAVAVRTYSPMHADEMVLRPGDVIAVAAEFDDGFAFGANLSRVTETGPVRGVFPMSCCEWQKIAS